MILFGNTAHVPTFLVPCSPGGNPADCNIASDLDYSTNGIGTDLFADVQLGRLPAPDLDAANALVTKLNTYATSSPAPPGDDFFDHAAVTSYFQPAMMCVLNEGATGTPDCNPEHAGFNAHWEIDYANHTDTRGFTITAERIRNAIAADGYTVDRLYTTDDEDVIPEYYWNGTPIPAHLKRPAFDWDANTTDFLDSYNDGRFVILHRDHGWPDGFAEPTIHSGHVPGLTNGSQQPVVFGINCASAAFDTPAHPSFVELQVLRPDGGAIAGFGDTRVSPSFPNNHMALGFFDAMFPSAVADYGGPETRRLGDILVRGKQYMATQEGFEWHGAGDTYVEHYLYHLLGDPTMQMWANPPVRFDPSRFSGVIRDYRELKPIPEPGDPPFYVRFEFAGEPLAIGLADHDVPRQRGHRARDRGRRRQRQHRAGRERAPAQPVAVAPAGRRVPRVRAVGEPGAAGADHAEVRQRGHGFADRVTRTRSAAACRRRLPGHRCAWSTRRTTPPTRTGPSSTRSPQTRRACGTTR